MNINHEYKYIFIHIPKNGGTSIARSLGFSSTTHHTAYQVKQILLESYNSYFVFAFFRNPIERFVSLYNYSRMPISYYHNNLFPERSIYGRHLDFEILKNKNINQTVFHLLKGDLKHDTSWNHWLPQAHWITDSDGMPLCHLYDLNNIDKFVLDFNIKFNINLNINNLNRSDRLEQNFHLNIFSKLLLRYYYRKDYLLKSKIL